MKKFFAVFLVVILLFSSNTMVRAAESAVETLTLEQLATIPSWNELLNTVDNIDIVANDEEWYCCWIINGIRHPQIIPIFHNEPYLSKSYGGIKLKEINQQQFLKKLDYIFNIYNASNPLHLNWKHTVLNENFMQVDIKSLNADQGSATYLGQKVLLKEGSIYWESPEHDGTGRFGIVNETNPYIPADRKVLVNGFVYYTNERRENILKNSYCPFKELANSRLGINQGKYRMIHICTAETDLGWVWAEDVIPIG